MALFRPVRSGDVASLWELVSGHVDELVGMTSLPTSLSMAEDLVAASRATVVDLAAGRFHLERNESRSVYFVVVDGDDRVVAVTSIDHKQQVLNLAVHLRTSDDGTRLVVRSSSALWNRTELGSTFVARSARGLGLGTLLSRARFLFLLLAAPQIPSVVAAHLRGVFDDDGTAPFWRHFGARFLSEWPASTDAERALQDDPARIASLSQRTIELSPEVLDCLGPVNNASRPAFHLLLQEGLRPNGMYDPVDGGPTLARPLGRTASAERRQVGTVAAGLRFGRDALVSSVALGDFGAIRSPADVDDEGRVVLEERSIERLGLEPGRLVSAVFLDEASDR